MVKVDPKSKVKERLGIILCASSQTIDSVLYFYILKKNYARLHIYPSNPRHLSTVPTCEKMNGKDQHISNECLPRMFSFSFTVSGRQYLANPWIRSNEQMLVSCEFLLPYSLLRWKYELKAGHGTVHNHSRANLNYSVTDTCKLNIPTYELRI